MGKRCLDPNIYDQEKENQIHYSTLRLNLRQSWSILACKACSKDFSGLKSVHEWEDTEPRVPSRLAPTLSSSGSSAYPLARPPCSTSASITQRWGLSPLHETTLCSDESQQLSAITKSLAAKPSEADPLSVLQSIVIHNPFTVSTEPQSQDSKFAAQFPFPMNVNIILDRNNPWLLLFCAEQCVIMKHLDKYCACI